MVLDNEFPFDTRVENEAISLINAGHKVHLACYTRKQLPEYEVFRQIVIHRIRISQFIYKSSVAALTFPVYFIFWKRFLNRIIEENNIEVLHIHDLPLTRVGKKLKERHSLKLVVDLHENWPVLLSVSTHTNSLLGKLLSPNFLWVRYERRVLKHADLIIVVVRESKERLERLGLRGSKICIVSNTLNINEFAYNDNKPDPGFFTLFYAGGINYHRGLQTVIEAISQVKDKIPNIRLRIVGAGSYMPVLKDQVKELKVERHVEFLGYLPLKKVAANLALADVALIPHLRTNHSETAMPHKLFQYMYSNKPIIASNCILMERIITETDSGLIFKAGSADDLANKILSISNKKVKIPPARRWVEEKYNWQVDAETLISSYKKI